MGLRLFVVSACLTRGSQLYSSESDRDSFSSNSSFSETSQSSDFSSSSESDVEFARPVDSEARRERTSRVSRVPRRRESAPASPLSGIRISHRRERILRAARACRRRESAPTSGRREPGILVRIRRKEGAKKKTQCGFELCASHQRPSIREQR